MKPNIFNEIYEKLLMEMPYLFDLNKAEIPNTGEHFDLELEKYSNEEELKEYLSKLFKAGTWTDKYGNSIIIRNWQDGQNLFTRMVKDRIVLKYIRHIVKLGNLLEAKRWLITFKKLMDRVSFAHESVETKNILLVEKKKKRKKKKKKSSYRNSTYAFYPHSGLCYNCDSDGSGDGGGDGGE